MEGIGIGEGPDGGTLPHGEQEEDRVDPDRILKVLEDVWKERKRQENLKAEGRFKYSCADPEMPLMEQLAVLGEEFGEACRAALEKRKLSYDPHGADLREELVQIAAVATAMIENLDTPQPAVPEDHHTGCPLYGTNCNCGKTWELESAVQYLLANRPWRTRTYPEWLAPLVQALENL